MLNFSIPGYGDLNLDYLVLDYNGTLACDGEIIQGVKEELATLSSSLEIHVITADTFGRAKAGLEGIPCVLSILAKDNQDRGKQEYVKKLGADHTAAIGNGRNDRFMLEESALGIAVILEEGVSSASLMACDIVFTDIVSALKILRNPLRLTATLRA